MAQLYSLATIILCAALAYLIYKFLTRNFDYWKMKGIPYIKPKLLIGNIIDIILFRKTIFHALADMYNEMSDPYFGIWVFNTPHFVVKCPELIKQILIKDFSYFQDRYVASNEEADAMTSYVLFFLKNPEWKIIRTKMSVAFTSGKIKSMVPLMNSAAEDMKKYLSKMCLKNDSLESKEICSKFSTDIITSCAFGIKANSFENTEAPWRQIGKEIFDFNFFNGIRNVAYFFLPKMVEVFKIKFLSPHTTTFLKNAFWQTIEKREKDNFVRNDFIDVLIKLKHIGTFDGLKFEGDRVVAQAVQFFIAGFDTTSMTISYTLYELCLNKNIQNKVRAEINATLKNYGVVTYEAIQDMKYLDKVIQETLRKYPVLPFLDRQCVMDYQIPGTNIVLEKGTPVCIPVLGLHYDPKYFSNPEVFDPERFSGENINSIPAYVFMPFGEGQHNCIGKRFGLTTSKLGLIHILSQFEVERSSNTPVPIEFAPKSLFLMSKIGLPMRFLNIGKTSYDI